MPPAAQSAPVPPRRIRLLIVNSTLHIGGAERIAACLARNVDRDAFEATACYLKEPGIVADEMLRSGVDLVPIPGLRRGRRDYLSSLKLRRLIRQRGIQVVHSHDIHSLVDGSACRLTTPGLRLVHTFHFGNYPMLYRRHQLKEGTLWRVADALVAVSYSQREALRRLYRIPEGRIRVIWNGVEDPVPVGSGLPLAWNRPAGIPVIASINTLIRQKGLEHLLDAAAMLRRSGEQFVLVIAGDGALRDSLAGQVARLGLGDTVRFLGWVSDASRRVMPACDVFVQSSLWEAMSVVVLEAMAASKPMVVTAVGENPRVVVNGETGLLVPPADSNALADGLRTLLRDAALRERMGQAARRRYLDQFTVRHMVSHYERLYTELVGVAA